MAIEDWDIDNIARETLKSLLEDYAPNDAWHERCLIEDVLDDELEDVGWTVYSRDTADVSHAVVALVKAKILDLL